MAGRAYGALRARPAAASSSEGLPAVDDPEGEAWGPPVRRPTEPSVVSNGAATRGAIIAAFSAPFVALLLVGAALSHQAANPVVERHQQIENIGVLGILIPTVAGGGSALRRNLELLHEQRTALDNPDAVEVFIHHPHEDAGHSVFHEIHAEKVERGRRTRLGDHPGVFFSSAVNVVSNAELEGSGAHASRTLRFKGWRFSKDTNAALSFVDRGGRTEVLQLESIRRSAAARIHQTIQTMHGVKYTVRYDVLLPALRSRDATHLGPGGEGVAPCGLDGTHGRAGKHYSTQANGSAWCGWRTGMLLLVSGGAGDLSKDLSKNAQENALLQLFPARRASENGEGEEEEKEGWLSLEVSVKRLSLSLSLSLF